MAKPGNNNLRMSKAGKQDEFYTQLSMIEDELRYYIKHFENKVIFCNCDDPYESNFFKFFAMRFNLLKLKKLIALSYIGSPVAQTQLSLFEENKPPKERTPYQATLVELEDYNGDGAANIFDVEWALKNKSTVTKLKGDGDFRSAESIEALQQADVVVTNPPFSLFREFVAQLMKYEKKFLILGNLNAVKYKEILPLIMQNKIWLGRTGGHFWFRVPEHYEVKATDFKVDEEGVKWRRMGNICWFTNLDYKERYEDNDFFYKYDPVVYPKYDNYDAIEVSKVDEIPGDYEGVMGVPITYLSRHNPNMFEILGVLNSGSGNEYDFAKAILNGKQLYTRILIRSKK